MPTKISPVILVFLGVGALDSGAVAPGAKVWIFPHFSSTNICHHPECSVEEGQLWCPFAGAAVLKSECNRV